MAMPAPSKAWAVVQTAASTVIVPAQVQGTTRRDALLQIEKQVQSAWAKEKTHEATPDDRPKYLPARAVC